MTVIHVGESDQTMSVSAESNITYHLHKGERRERILQRGDVSRDPDGVAVDKGILRDDCYRAHIQCDAANRAVLE